MQVILAAVAALGAFHGFCARDMYRAQGAWHHVQSLWRRGWCTLIARRVRRLSMVPKPHASEYHQQEEQGFQSERPNTISMTKRDPT